MSQIVYFVRRGGLVKIGTTRELQSRLRGIEGSTAQGIAGMTGRVEVLAVMPGGEAVERAMHEMFAGLRYAKEWFFYEQPLVAFVEAVAAAGVASREHHARARREPRKSDLPPSSTDLREALGRGEVPWVLSDAAKRRRLNRPGGATGLREAAWSEVVDPLAELLTLRDAVDQGVVPVSQAAAKMRFKRARQRGEPVPPVAGVEGAAYLYTRGELTAWTETWASKATAAAEQRATQEKS